MKSSLFPAFSIYPGGPLFMLQKIFTSQFVKGLNSTHSFLMAAVLQPEVMSDFPITFDRRKLSSGMGGGRKDA